MRAAPKGLGATPSGRSRRPSGRCRTRCTRSAWSSSSSGTRCSSTGSSWRSASGRRSSTPDPEEPGPAWDQRDRVERSRKRHVQLRHHDLRAVPGRLSPRRSAPSGCTRSALGLAAVSLIWLAHIGNQYVALVPMIGMGIFWASTIGVPYTDGRQHGPGQPHRGLHGDPQHDDRGADADRRRSRSAGSSRNLLGRQGHQRDHARRRPVGHRRRRDAVGQPAGRAGRVADHAARQPPRHHGVRPGHGRFGRHARPACRPSTGRRGWRRPPRRRLVVVTAYRDGDPDDSGPRRGEAPRHLRRGGCRRASRSRSPG